MIKKLKFKFIVLSMSSLFVLLTVIVVGMNWMNYKSVVMEADNLLEILSKHKGGFPDVNEEKHKKDFKGMSPETPYESRYFSVLLDSDNEVIETDTSRIISVDSVQAIEYATDVVKMKENTGFYDRFRYFKTEENGEIRIIFLDCGRSLDSVRNFMTFSVSMSLCGLVIVFWVIFFMADKIISPIAKSYEKQKRFITDAGHEMKTPITIINANLDILEMENQQNECLDDIKQQTKRLKELTNSLVVLARMEEAEDNMQMIEFPVSDVVADTANPFRTLAKGQGKELLCEIQPMLSFEGNEMAFTQLVTILLDNALKYSPVSEFINLKLYKKNKTLYLTVINKVVNEISNENLENIFERFYRLDASRNSKTGGHGIGLSVAKAIVVAHGGKISASVENGGEFHITAKF